MAETILVLAANPRDTSRLRLDQEIREIDSGLQRSQKREDFTLKQIWAARPIDVRRAVLDSKPRIIHFCGHGEGKDGIAFEDNLGNTKLVIAEALAGFFQLFADKVECVVLNACHSEIQAEAIAQHIKYVVGMGQEIGDIAAIDFSVAFYDALGAGKSIDFAYKLACNAIQWSGSLEHLTPILKTQISSGKLIYDGQTSQDFNEWTTFSTVGGISKRVQLIKRTPDKLATFEIKAFSTESVGVNKSFRILYGKVEFEYKIIFSVSTQPNIYFCMIPMQETNIGRTGLIEVGTQIQDDPQNPCSPHRERFYAPMENYGREQWHKAEILFDFRQIPTAFYSIFAPRINEGCSNPGAAHFLTTKIRMFSFE